MTEYNAAALFIDRPVADGRGDRVALVGPGVRLTYQELSGLVDRTGHALRRLGVEPEQRVALHLPDGPAFAATFFGALKLGAVAVPLNTRLDAPDRSAILDDCRAKVVVTDSDTAVSTGVSRHGDKTVSWQDLVADAPAATLEPEPVGPDAMAFWLYTSGTTGFPKAAVHPHRTLEACRHYGIDVLGVNPDDRVYATSKLYFAYALGNALLIPLFAGASSYLHPAWPDPAVVATVMRDYRPTLFFSVPTLYARLLRADLAPDTFASVRLCVSAGERLPADIYNAWRARFGVEILDGIGATETVFMMLSNRPDSSRPGSSGMPVPGTEARILDQDQREIASGGAGVLWVKTPSAAMGYWRHLDQSRRAFVGEWFRTGDVYTRDDDGFYYHQGREDDFFKVAGQWVAPGEVEQVVRRHPDVADAGVVGAEEAGGLVKPYAFVVPRGGAPDDMKSALRRLLDETLKPHQRPREIVIVDELPRTATGKLQRFKLREWAEGRTLRASTRE